MNTHAIEGIETMKTGNVTKKLLVIGVLTLLLLVPIIMVQGRVLEREIYQQRAGDLVADSWGGTISIVAPSLTYQQAKLEAISTVTKISVDRQVRDKGQFKIPVYTATVNIVADFRDPQRNFENPDKDARYKLVIAGAKVVDRFKVRDAETGEVLETRQNEDGISINSRTIMTARQFPKKLHIEFVARGSGELRYESFAKNDEVTMTGNWKDPLFTTLSPNELRPAPDGFEAVWATTTQLNSTYGRVIALKQLVIGTDYGSIVKATKYAILFVVLTFLLVFIAEYSSKARFHPLQYTLIGLAICVFYLLLLAITEKTGFLPAYTISGAATATLVVAYVQGFIRQKKFVYLIGFEQVTVLAFFYVLIRLEDVALLLGSIAVFIVLATLMLLTRKIDWYSSEESPRMKSHEAINTTI